MKIRALLATIVCTAAATLFAAPISAAAPQTWGWLRNANSGKCMNIPGGDTSWGAKVTQFTCGDWADHHWTWEHREGDFFWIRNKNSGLCLAVPGGSTEPNTQLIQWPCDPRFEDHLWRQVPHSIGDNIINKRSGDCVAVRDGNGADHAPVIQFPCGSWRDHFWAYLV